jgi:L-fuculose-phosphate aldolase
MANEPTDAQARRLIIEIGRRMYDKNYVAANDGNLSCKTGEGAIWATPTGVSKGFLQEDELVKLKPDGTILQKGERAVSSEIKLHLRIYNENPSVGGVVHSHSPASTAFAIAGIALDKPLYPEILINTGIVPCLHYTAAGTQDVPDSVAPYAKDYNAVLLGNHGPVCWGNDLMQAFYRLEAVEHYCQIQLYLKILGRENLLTREQVDDCVARREREVGKAGGYPSVFASTLMNGIDVLYNKETTNAN